MNGKIAWRLSAMTFDASRHERCPRLLAPIIFQFGVAWFWLALTVEGRAGEAWRELRANNPSQPGVKVTSVWAHSTQDLRQALIKGAAVSLPLVPAWSLPENRRMRGLGLGRMWAVLCPYCSQFHTHSPGEGHRTAHCCAHRDGKHYVLEFAGALPPERQNQFHDWIQTALPRFVQHWAETESPPAESLAA